MKIKIKVKNAICSTIVKCLYRTTVLRKAVLLPLFVVGIPTLTHATTYGNDDCKFVKQYAKKKGITLSGYSSCMKACESAYGLCPTICEKCGYTKASETIPDNDTQDYTSLRQIKNEDKISVGTKLTMWCRPEKKSHSKKTLQFYCKDSQSSSERPEVIKVKNTPKAAEAIEKNEDSNASLKIEFEITEVGKRDVPTFTILRVY